MMTQTKKLTAAIAFCVMLAPAAASANMQDTVRDERGNVVLDSNGGCVLTKWDADRNACTPGRKMTVAREERTIYFDFNKSALTTESKKKLDTLISQIRASKQVVSVDIVGHADKMGTDSYNDKLSMKRAMVVKDYLAAKGKINTRNVDVKALGEANPTAKCDDSMPRDAMIACLKQDRRVEIELNLAK